MRGGSVWYAARALKDPNDGLSQLARQQRAATPWLNAVWQFIGSVFFLVGVGYGVDKYWGTGPWGLVVGGVVGSAVGFYAFITAANRLMAQSSRSSTAGKSPQQTQSQKPTDLN